MPLSSGVIYYNGSNNWMSLVPPKAYPDIGIWLQVDYFEVDPRKHQLENKGVGQGREESQDGYVGEQVTIVLSWDPLLLGPLEGSVENASKLSYLMERKLGCLPINIYVSLFKRSSRILTSSHLTCPTRELSTVLQNSQELIASSCGLENAKCRGNIGGAPNPPSKSS